MLTVLSPAKSMREDRAAATPRATQPRLLAEAEVLVARLRGLSPARLAKLMGVSEELARLNAARFAAWQPPFTTRNAWKAILLFDGDVYRGLDRDAYDRDDFAFAQTHVRILSGLYGVLRPLDLIQPYRLEMGTTLKVGRAPNLYAYWGAALADQLAADLRRHRVKVLVNLASDEYFRAVRPLPVGIRVIKPVFKERRGEAYKVIAFSAKRARGLMADFIVRHRIDDPEGLAGFSVEGYRLDRGRSGGDELVFTRRGPR